MRLIVLILFVFSAQFSTAQSISSNGHDANFMTDQFTKLYGLDASQASQYKSLIVSKMSSLKKIQGKVLTQNDLNEIRGINKKFDQDVLSILNDKQKTAYLALKSKTLNPDAVPVNPKGQSTVKPKAIK